MTRPLNGPGFEVREDGRARFQNLDSGRPREWYRFENAATSRRAKVNIYGDIGDSWWSNSVSAASFVKALDDLDVDDIDLHLNSRGGDAFDGITIYNALRAHAANVVVYVDGLAASAASVIAMAGDEIVMGKGAELMIHDASGLSFGNAADMAKMGSILDKLSGSIADIYADTAGGTAEEWRAAMQEESWYTAEEAVAAKLASRVAKKGESSDAGDAVTPGADESQDDGLDDSWRASNDLRVFHYQGRRQAPAPMIPAARMTARANDTNERNQPVNPEQLAALRRALGASEDASPDALIALAQETTTALADAPLDDDGPKNSLPDGAVAVDASVLESLRADAAAGRQAREAQLRAHRESLVAEAFRTGRITAAGREGWLNKLTVEGEQAEKDLMSLQAGLIPVEEKGHDFGSVGETPEDAAEAGDADAVRALPGYQNWRF